MTTREPSPAMVPARVMPAPSLPPLVDPAVLASTVRAGVRRTDINQAVYDVDSFLVALVVEDLASGRPSLVLEPVSEGGYRLRGVREGSVFAALGLLDGDVVESLNGVALHGPPPATPNPALAPAAVDPAAAANPAANPDAAADPGAAADPTLPVDPAAAGDPASPTDPAPDPSVAAGGLAQALAALSLRERGVVFHFTRAGVGTTQELRFVDGLTWSQVATVRTGAPLPAAEGIAVIADPVFPDMPVAPAPGVTTAPGTRLPATRPAATGARPSTNSAPGSTVPQPPVSGAGAITCGADGTCSVARRDFDAMVAAPEKLLRQVQVSEARGGYKLGGIRSGSQVSQLGFRNGDVLRSVNGTQLDDQLGLLGLYGGLGSTRTYNVVYERNGVRHTKTVKLRE